MANASKTQPSLGLAFLFVTVVLVGLSIAVQFLASINPPQNSDITPIPTQTLNQGGHKSTILSFLPESAVNKPITSRH